VYVFVQLKKLFTFIVLLCYAEISGGAKNVPNVCMSSSAKQSKWIKIKNNCVITKHQRMCEGSFA